MPTAACGGCREAAELQRSKNASEPRRASAFFGNRKGRVAITRRSLVQILPPQSCCATKKDIAPENPDTRAVSGFFRAPILGCKQKDIFLCPEDLNYHTMGLAVLHLPDQQEDRETVVEQRLRHWRRQAKNLLCPFGLSAVGRVLL